MLSLITPQDQLAHDIRAVFARRCEEDAWSVDVRACVMSTVSLKDPKHCKAKLAPGARGHLETDLALAQGRARERNIPEECKAYGRMVDALVACDKVPQEARRGVRQAYESMKESWTTTDASKRAALIMGCKAAADAMKQSVGGIGCAQL